MKSIFARSNSPWGRAPRGYRRLQIAIVIGVALLCATLAFGALRATDRTLASQWAQTKSALDRSGKAAESIVNNQFLQVDTALASLPALFSSLTTGQGPGLTAVAASRLLQGMNFQSLAFRDIILLRPTGEVWASARQTARQMSFPIPVAELTAGRSPGAAAIFGPMRNRLTGEWVLYLVRQIQLPEMGAVFAAAEIPTSMITGPLGSLAEMPGLRIRLQRGDATLLASVPHDETAIGQVVDMRSDQTDVTLSRFGDDAPTLRFARPLLYSEMLLVVLLDGRIALADWRVNRDRLTISIGGAAAMLVLFGVVVLLGLRWQARLEAARAQAQSLLEDAIESMSDGFVIWDAENRLVTCNSYYRDLYKPSAPFLVPGNTFEEIMRKGAEAGQYPQAGNDLEKFVRDMVAWHKAGQGSFERQLPDGRWLLVTERRTSNGGAVGMRKDITELKRQKELIESYGSGLQGLAYRFETTVKTGAAQVELSAKAASTEAELMASAAADAMSQARFVSQSAEATSASVEMVATGADELLQSIKAISEQVRMSARMSDHAAECAAVAQSVMAQLDDSASRITVVVDLIGSIASQTNLLALNATIEAARAGEAGRGFAVVASEVKALAAQTTRSTDSIAQQIRAIQDASREAAATIASINEIVSSAKEIAARVEQSMAVQSAAAFEIAANTAKAAGSTADVSRAVLMIAERSEQINATTENLRGTAQRLLAEAKTLGSESERFLRSVQAAR